MVVDYAQSHFKRLHQAGILPPWLWFWLIIYILKLPGLIQFLWEQNIKPVLSAILGDNLIDILLALPSIHEILPPTMLFLGVISILFPHLRKTYIERCDKLSKPQNITPVVKEILEIVHSYAPGVDVKANLLRTDKFAFIYPTGYRTAAIAIFGGLVKLWRSDKEAAKAMLLHELGHCRHGDALIIGAGSFFEALLNSWLPLLFLFFFIPSILIDGWLLIHSLHNFLEIHQLSHMSSQFQTFDLQILRSDNWFLDWLCFQIKLLFTVKIPGTISILVSLVFFTPAILTTPLIAIWCAEFNADQFVITDQQSSDNLLRGVEKLSPPTSLWQWLLFRLSHPPNKLRQWMARHSMVSKQLFFLFLLFPLAYIVQFFFLLIRSYSALLMIHTIGDIFQKSPHYVGIYFHSVAPVLLGIGIILLLYPKFAVVWEKLFCQENDTINPPLYKEYFVSGIIVGCFAVIGYTYSLFF